MNPNHEQFMQRAIELTANTPELPFAAVIVDRETGEILSEGWNKAESNPLCHGEIDALYWYFKSNHRSNNRELILYSTAEPCPMCMGAILWSGIDTVVFGTSIRFLIDIGWRQIDIPASEVANRSSGMSCKVIGGVLESECNDLFFNTSRAAPGR